MGKRMLSRGKPSPKLKDRAAIDDKPAVMAPKKSKPKPKRGKGRGR